MVEARAAKKSRKVRAKGGAVRRGASARGEAPSLPPGISFPLVAIGASAGGLAAFTELLKALPTNTGMAFVLIQHLEPKHESALTALLSKTTSMPVVEVSEGMAVEQNCVYVIPPNRDMTIRKGTLRLAPRAAGSGLQRPIDEFSIALAEEQGNAAIGVILSGTGSDGTYGLKAIKAAGGVTFAQDPKTAQWPAMPANAITAGAVDFVLPPKRIAAELARIGRLPYLVAAQEVPEGSDLDKVCLILRSAMGVDFRLYKQATVRRRIARRMALEKISSLSKYAESLKRNPEQAQALADDIFIHVTSFFRDPDCFRALRKGVLEKLYAKRSADDPIRIWVAGCSTGEEVYSIAMLLLEELGDRANRIKIQIFGTDVQERAVAYARGGIYTEAAVAGVSPALLKRYFAASDHGYQIQKAIRDLCVFARHDLAKDPPFSRLDLISCRNVLIYMGVALQKRILTVFQYALKPGGFLFLGNSESVSNYSEAFAVEDQKHRIFLRKPSASTFREFGPAADFPREQNAAPPLRASAPSLTVDFRREAEGMLLEQYTPPALVVDPDLHIVHFQGDVSPYLGPATGQPSFHLLKITPVQDSNHRLNCKRQAPPIIIPAPSHLLTERFGNRIPNRRANRMVQAMSLFNQLLQHFPSLEFAGLVKKHRAERAAKGFSCRTQLVAMLFCQLAHADSLREICNGLACCLGKLVHLGIKVAPNKSTLAYANQHRSAALYEELFYTVLGRFRDEKGLGLRKSRFRFKNKLLSLDSTTISLCLEIFPWAKFRRAKGGVKAHVLLDHDDYLPRYVLITEARRSDVKMADAFPLNPGSIVAMDRGYNDYALFGTWTDQKIYFVTRLKENAAYEVLEEGPLPANRGIRADQLIQFTGEKAQRDCPNLLRRVAVWDAINEREIVLLTNLMEFGSTTIAAIYKDRWEIELFFKALKQNLKLKSFVGTSENALRIQIWTSLIAILLLKWLHHLSKAKWSLSNLASMLRLNLFTYRDLTAWLDNPFGTPPLFPESQQLALGLA